MIETEQVFQRLKALVAETSVGKMPGKLLYSSRATLRPGDLYVLGYNPGGDPDQEADSVAKTLERTPPQRWTEYTCERWMLRKKPYDPGEQPRQLKIKKFFDIAKRDLKEVFCSNVLFARDIDVARTRSHPEFNRFFGECKEIHQYLIGVVKPRIVVCFGKDAVKTFARMELPEFAKDVLESEGRNRKLILFNAPHFSRGSNEVFFDHARLLKSIS